MSSTSAIHRFLERLRASLEAATLVRLRLSSPTNPEASIQSVEARVIELRGAPHLNITERESKRDVTRNRPLTSVRPWLEPLLGEQFRTALLQTTQRDWQLHVPAKGSPRLVAHKPASPVAPSRSHDKTKSNALGPKAVDWLSALGIADEHGRPKPSMADKYRQICRYTEIFSHLAQDCGWKNPPADGAPALKIADMGCGKGYLTFAAWHLFRRTLHRTVSVMGVETRPALVTTANAHARRIGAEGLEFIAGDIASVEMKHLDALIALHACNTATDDAIRRGIELGAMLIVVAPCCHQALRPELGKPEPFSSLMRHGLFKERMAEWLTDALRCLFLEWAGYQCKVIEFVGSEHTPKNLMIAAVQKQAVYTDAKARERIVELKTFFGIKHTALDDLLQ